MTFIPIKYYNIVNMSNNVYANYTKNNVIVNYVVEGIMHYV